MNQFVGKVVAKRVVLTLASTALSGALLAAPATAPAATTCAFGGGVLEVQLPEIADDAFLSVLDGGEIVVEDSNPIACAGGTPTVTTTNVISIFNAVGAGENEVLIRGSSRFAPGANAAGEGTPEIEISVNLNDRPGSALGIGATTFGFPIRFGTSGINTNAFSGEVLPDADVFPAGVPALTGITEDGGGTLRAEGGAGTGGPLTDRITFFGGAGPDLLAGGDGDDVVFGNNGDDTLLGNAGNDTLEPDAGNDSIDGGSGTDSVGYGITPGVIAGVTVDLAIAGPQNTGAAGTDSLIAVERLGGTALSDVLRGDAGPNLLVGGGGDDVLDGRGGVDELAAGPGADSLFVRDGGPDDGDCGTEIDTVTADPVGVDTLTGCETVTFPLAPPPGSTAPETIKGKGPKRKLSKRKARFSFSSDDPAARFECKLDKKGFKPCSSPAKVKKLNRGKHTFEARAVAGDLVDPTPASWKFKVLRGKR